MSCTTNDLSDKIVISVIDGRKLGYIDNYEVDPCCGKITAVFVPENCGKFSFGKGDEIKICWEKIQRIGEDAILVEAPPRPCVENGCECKKQKHIRWIF